MYSLYWVLFIGIAVISWIVSARMQSKFKKYSQIPMPNGMTGREVAEKMLRENGITDVRVISVAGQLTDHYNPVTKTVNLSEPAYGPLKMRSALVPVVSFSSNIVQWVLLGGMLMLKAFPQLLLIGIILFAVTTLFSFITLPVEINASRRALAWLKTAGITNYQTDGMAKDALRSAAYTYVVAALGSLATLLYYILIFLGGRRN